MHKLRSLPSTVGVALSGGVDSVVLLHFLRKKHDVTALHYVHNSAYAAVELSFVTALCDSWSVPLLINHQPTVRPSGLSTEEYWRHGRYQMFKSFEGTVCTAHNLDDATEWYIFSSLNGEGHYMAYRNGNVVRPFLCQTKSAIYDYARENKLEWIEDPSNENTEWSARNKIRHELMPLALKINPGLRNMVRRRIETKTHESEK